MSRYYDRRRDYERDRDRYERGRGGGGRGGRGGRDYDDFRGPPLNRASDLGNNNNNNNINNNHMSNDMIGEGGHNSYGHTEAIIGGAGKRMHRIFGTEEDKVNCSFYFKIGACRHGERCSRLHMKPNFSQTLLLAHFYMPPPDATAASEEEKKRQEMIGINAYNNKPMPHGVKTDDFSNNLDNDAEMDDQKRLEKEKRQRELDEHYEDFYEDVVNEMIKYGDVEELVVCENSGDHMYGNTYVKFSTEEQAAQALVNLRGRYYCGRIIQAEYSPVTDFREGRCRQFDEHNCSRGPYCNFLHLRPVPKFARRYLRRTRLKARYQYGNSDGRRRRRHKLRLNGLTGSVFGNNLNESSDDSSLSDDSDYYRRWRSFPIRGNSQERRDCIAQWNEMLDERKEKKKKKKANKMAKKQQDNPNNNDNNNNNRSNSNTNDDNATNSMDIKNSNDNTNNNDNNNNSNSNNSSKNSNTSNNNQDITMDTAMINLPANPPLTNPPPTNDISMGVSNDNESEAITVRQPYMNPERLRMLQRS